MYFANQLFKRQKEKRNKIVCMNICIEYLDYLINWIYVNIEKTNPNMFFVSIIVWERFHELNTK